MYIKKALLFTFLLTFPLVWILTCIPINKEDSFEAVDIEDLGEQAYYYGLQQTIFYGQRWLYTQDDRKDNLSFQGVNRLFNIRKPLNPDSGFPVVTPNATTLYGTGIIDLQKEPLIIEMPEIEDRYFSLQIMNQYGIFYLMAGNQFNGTKARKYFIKPVGYSGTIPSNFVTTDVIPATSNIGYIFVRIAVEEGTEEEITHINQLQDQISITPLSNWASNNERGISNKEIPVVKGDYVVYDRIAAIADAQVDKQTPEDYFTLLHLVLNDPSMTLIHDSQKESKILSQLNVVGIGKGLDFQWSSLDKDTKTQLSNGFKKGFENLRKTLQTSLINMNGWMEVRNSGGFETQWIDRAIMGDAGWAGPDKNVSHTGAFRFVDAENQQLNSSNNYTLTFNTADLPPVSQFWSIPIYDKNGYFVKNEIDRYTINSFMLEQDELHVEDGQLIIYVQKERPTDPKQLKNWLPAPEGDFRFTARFYGPSMAIIDGSYKMPAPVKQ